MFSIAPLGQATREVSFGFIRFSAFFRILCNLPVEGSCVPSTHHDSFPLLFNCITVQASDRENHGAMIFWTDEVFLASIFLGEGIIWIGFPAGGERAARVKASCTVFGCYGAQQHRRSNIYCLCGKHLELPDAHLGFLPIIIHTPEIYSYITRDHPLPNMQSTTISRVRRKLENKSHERIQQNKSHGIGEFGLVIVTNKPGIQVRLSLFMGRCGKNLQTPLAQK